MLTVANSNTAAALVEPSNAPSTVLVVVQREDAQEQENNKLSIVRMDYNSYRVRVDQMKHHFDRAYQSEQDAYKKVQGVQQDLLTLLTDPKFHDRADLQRAKQAELAQVEAEWQNCALFCAELRNEIHDLAKQRDGDYTDEFKFSGIHSLDHCKPVPFKAKDISPERKRVARDAYPEVDPLLGINPANPGVQITADAMRHAFQKLGPDASGTISLESLVRHLDSKGDFGIPNFAKSFVTKTLKELKTAPVNGDRIDVDQFGCVMLRWAAL